MKKYFMKETGNEVHFGDTIELDFEKRTKHGKTSTHIQCKFHPALVELLEKKGLLEVKEVEDEESLEFESEEELLQFLLDTLDRVIDINQKLEDRVMALEEEMSKLLKKNGKSGK